MSRKEFKGILGIQDELGQNCCLGCLKEQSEDLYNEILKIWWKLGGHPEKKDLTISLRKIMANHPFFENLKIGGDIVFDHECSIEGDDFICDYCKKRLTNLHDREWSQRRMKIT